MVATLLISLLIGGSSLEAATEQAALQCNVGPAVMELGGNDWVVYGCVDDQSVVVIANSPNPAAPFVFIIMPNGSGGIELHGEGTGAKSATKPAYDALSTMSGSDLAALFERARLADRP
jgi:hypothetical protein